MLLNSKRGQLSIEMVILILAILLGGTIFATHMTKDATSTGEVQELKKLTLGAFSSSAVELGAYVVAEEDTEPEAEDEEENESEAEDEEENTIESITGTLNINPGQGLGYGIYEFYAEYFTDTYYIDKWKGNLYVTKGPGDITYLPYTGQATEIKLKAKSGTSLSINGDEIPSAYDLYTITAKNSGESFTYYLSGESSGQMYLTIEPEDYDKITVKIEHNGNGDFPDLIYPNQE